MGHGGGIQYQINEDDVDIDCEGEPEEQQHRDCVRQSQLASRKAAQGLPEWQGSYLIISTKWKFGPLSRGNYLGSVEAILEKAPRHLKVRGA